MNGGEGKGKGEGVCVWGGEGFKSIKHILSQLNIFNNPLLFFNVTYNRCTGANLIRREKYLAGSIIP